jgi:hypothetical protein
MNTSAAIPFFRSQGPGIRLVNRIARAEIVGALPQIDAAGEMANAAWFRSAAIDGFTHKHDGSPALPRTSMRILASDEGLWVGARLEEPTPERMKRMVAKDSTTGALSIPGAPIAYEAWKDDHLEIALDVAHRHLEHARFFLTCAGYAEAWHEGYAYEESIHAQCSLSKRLDAAWRHATVVGNDAWYAFMRIPWATIGVDAKPETAIGFSARRMRAVERLCRSAWTPMAAPHAMVALDFGELHLTEAPAVVNAIDIGRPVLDANVLQLELASAAGASVRAQATVTDGGGRVTGTSTAAATLPRDGAARLSIPYRLDWHEPGSQELTIELSDAATGTVFHRCAYTFNRLRHLCVTDRLDWSAPAPDPTPEDADFMSRKRDFLLSRIPRFVRRSTVQGAPSDFCIESADGSVRFDLMAPDPCRAIAAFIESRFERDEDRLAGASVMMHQKEFVRHSVPLTHMHGEMSPESVLRFGGGHCYARAVALAGVMRAMRRADGTPCDASIMFVLGHVIVCVLPERYLFDPTFGTFHYRHDNRGLATERQIADDLTLADRCIRGRHKDFFHPDSHALAPVGSISWPAGAGIVAERPQQRAHRHQESR